MAVVCEHLAYRAPNPVVGILIETLQHPHNFPLIENRRSIAEHMYGPATNRGIGVVGHLQYPLPDLGNVGFQFAWAERVERFAALARVRTVSEFKPVRDIALVSSHDQQVVLSRPRPHQRSLGAGYESHQTEYRVWSPVGRLGPNCSHLGRGWACELRSMSATKETAQVLHESLARIPSVWFDRYLLREILK